MKETKIWVYPDLATDFWGNSGLDRVARAKGSQIREAAADGVRLRSHGEQRKHPQASVNTEAAGGGGR